MSTQTFGPAYDRALDEQRIRTQMQRVRDVLLAASIRGQWMTLKEISQKLEEQWRVRFGEASVSADLRHLRKKRFGGYVLEKRRRQFGDNASVGLWEYLLRAPVVVPALQLELLKASEKYLR